MDLTEIENILTLLEQPTASLETQPIEEESKTQSIIETQPILEEEPKTQPIIETQSIKEEESKTQQIIEQPQIEKTKDENEVRSCVTVALLNGRSDVIARLYASLRYDYIVEMVANHVGEMKNWDIKQLSEIAMILAHTIFGDEYKTVCKWIDDKLKFRNMQRQT